MSAVRFVSAHNHCFISDGSRAYMSASRRPAQNIVSLEVSRLKAEAHTVTSVMNGIGRPLAEGGLEPEPLK